MTRHNITDRFAVIDLKLQEIERFQGGGKVLLPLSPQFQALETATNKHLINRLGAYFLFVNLGRYTNLDTKRPIFNTNRPVSMPGDCSLFPFRGFRNNDVAKLIKF